MIAILTGLLLGAAAPTPGDSALVRAAEERWSAAFVTGDTAYLQQLLAPDYVSVGADGASHPKATVIAAARKFAAAHPGTVAQPLSASSTIQVQGATALVRHFGAADISVDVFQKRGGKWIAWFSQHTAVKPTP